MEAGGLNKTKMGISMGIGIVHREKEASRVLRISGILEDI